MIKQCVRLPVSVTLGRPSVSTRRLKLQAFYLCAKFDDFRASRYRGIVLGPQSVKRRCRMTLTTPLLG